jgi:hypothetical protein
VLYALPLIEVRLSHAEITVRFTVYDFHLLCQEHGCLENRIVFLKIPLMIVFRPVQEHYCLAVGINDARGLLAEFHLPTYSPGPLSFPGAGLPNAD